MKKNIKRIVLISTICIVALASATATGAVVREANIINEYSKMSQDQIVENLTDEKPADMLKISSAVFKGIEDKQTSDAVIAYASVIDSRINELDENKIVSEICNGKSDEFYRITLLQSYSNNFKAKTDANGEKIISLLEKEDTPSELKQNIILRSKFDTEESVAILREMCDAPEELVAYQAIKVLSEAKPEEAQAKAETILNNYQNEQVEKVNIALTVEANNIKNNPTAVTEQEKSEFLNRCLDIMDKNKDDKLGECAYTAIAEMGDINAVTEIIRSDKFTESQKSYGINKNVNVLMSMPDGNDKLQLITEAANLCPLNEFKEVLESARGNAAVDQEAVEKGLELIERYGRDANPRLQ